MSGYNGSAPDYGTPGSPYTPPPGQYPPGYAAPGYPPPGYVPVAYVPVGYVPAEPDAPSGGFAVLGFFFPIVGLILYLVWNDRTPLKARSVGKGALIGAIVYAASGILYALFLVSLITSLR